ncbi:DUF4350 domain-containing protein [Mucilaginibacter psychrotolerans]|uniref:DUF4350 domain-containing protein n=1 Tax=Mucilaginibacter psychrotolerans TaxID=1524096 RepID=A0A4Y8SDN7_9SPHI|nr:DUF4350 domain-containing protein [Mucilaginibacter psychrotolerans]TFF36564.1 DUF4350 domain-containing protein [Mucilaginibacter psychrotolerans]
MKDFKVYLSIASLFLLVYLVAEYKRPKPIDWTPTFLKKDKIPLGTYVLYNRLRDIFPGADIRTYREPAYNVLADHGIKHATYLIIANKVNIDKADYSRLSAFVKQGNNVFIAATYFGDFLHKELKVDADSYSEYRMGTDSLHFVNQKLDISKIYMVEPELQSAHFAEFDTLKAIVLAQDSHQQTTYIKFPMGKGALYLNTTPHLFTNYGLLDQGGAQYASTALSYLKTDKALIWDEYYTLGRGGEQSIMRVFFKSPPLKWAYFQALAALILYVLYQMKRHQRIIPIVEPLANSTLGFVQVVGQLYYEKRNNHNIAQKKASYFLEHLRQDHRLVTTILDKDFTQSFANKTGVDYQLAEKLVAAISYVERHTSVTDRELIELNQLIENYYTQTGSYGK